MNTLLLDLTNWDLCIDANGNIAMAAAPYAIAQDVASAQRTFQGEVYYDETLGVPYFQAPILGGNPPVSLLAEYEVQAARTVPGVVAEPAPVFSVSDFTNRGVTGSTTFTDTDGNIQTVILQ
jgi:hypothetical protein